MKRLFLVIIFILFVSVSTFFAIDSYIGENYMFIIFSISSNVLLYFGFRKNAIFFDTFIGVFLWLGFWLKTTVLVIFYDSKFTESTGSFNGSGVDFDNALFVASVGFIALILASLIRAKYIFVYPKEETEDSGLFYFYSLHRNKILFAYSLLFIGIAVTNIYFSIYQRAGSTPENIPFIITGIYKWLLLFGLSSFAALILKYEFILNKKMVFFVPLLTLIEATITNASLLSRGVMLNASALGLGIIHTTIIYKIKTNAKYWFILVFTLIILFIFSVPLVDKLRDQAQASSQTQSDYQSKIINSTIDAVVNFSISNTIKSIGVGLIINRSVGMEGLLAISNSSGKSWELFNKALKEKYVHRKNSFYDTYINSRYKNSDEIYQHTMSFPGFIAFFYYPGSILFLFFIIFIIGLFSASIEIMTYKLGQKNLILAALIAQVIAYRLIHFGYVPGQSYLLFGTIFLNIFIIYGVNKILSMLYKNKMIDAKK